MLSCTNKNEIVIDSFKEFPEEIQSCACYFSRTKDDLYNGKYIFTDNDNDIGFISINDKMLKLELVGYDEISNTHWVKVFKNKEYQITVDSEQNWQVDQIWHQRAVITIKDNKGKLVIGSEHVFGECGGC
jgi:uncharacterized membrane protein YfhO